MAKAKTVFFCTSCGHEASKWMGKCPSCGEWNTFTEEVVQKTSKGATASQIYARESKPSKLKDIPETKIQRIDIKDDELNRVLGGGLVPGEIVLLGGEPGIGKSTLMLQIALQLENLKILYVSGEESLQQIKLRATRINKDNDNCYFLTETSLERILSQCETFEPDLIIVDSIQTLSSDLIDSTPGTVSQVRECAARLLQYAKQKAVPVILIGHINKEGNLAGPKVLEHIVDAVLQFEGDHNYNYRIIRSLKNRFGSTNEIGIYEMESTGLRGVANPSELLLTVRDEDVSGVCIGSSMEGNRPLLIEVQSLVSPSAFTNPQRSATGFDLRRLNMLLAVLEKRAGFKLSGKDVFFNVAGGLRVSDPALDLAVLCSILSSGLNLSVSHTDCYIGEIGLSGEIRPVSRLDQRIAEAEKLGFKKVYAPGTSKKMKNFTPKIEVLYFQKLDQLFKWIFR